MYDYTAWFGGHFNKGDKFSRLGPLLQSIVSLTKLSVEDLFCILTKSLIFSSPGQSPGRAIVLPPASALALALALALAKC